MGWTGKRLECWFWPPCFFCSDTAHEKTWDRLKAVPYFVLLAEDDLDIVLCYFLNFLFIYLFLVMSDNSRQRLLFVQYDNSTSNKESGICKQIPQVKPDPYLEGRFWPPGHMFDTKSLHTLLSFTF